jgi:rhodanese-related sulfurtransferase
MIYENSIATGVVGTAPKQNSRGLKRRRLITIHPLGLATLIENHELVDLIDVRTEQEFESFHIDGALSAPLGKLSAPKVLQGRKLAATKPLFIICSCRIRASLAAGILTGGGCCLAVVVDGGMDAWTNHGLSVARKKHFWNLRPSHSKAVNFDADNAGTSLISEKNVLIGA